MPTPAAMPADNPADVAYGRTHAVIARAVAALDLGLRFDEIDGTIPGDPSALTIDRRLGLPGLRCADDEHATTYLAMVGVMAVRELERLEGSLFGSDAEEAAVAPAIAEGGPVVECLAWIANNKTRLDEIHGAVIGNLRGTWAEFAGHVAEAGPACHYSIDAQKPLFRP